jgi:hypothetical protein
MTEDPLASVRPRIQSVKWQAEELLRAYPIQPVTKSTGGDAAAQELWGELGGAISREFFGRKRPGAKIGRAFAATNQRVQRAQADRNARDQALGVARQAREIVEASASTVGPRVLQSLHRGLADAEAARRADTVLRKVLLVTGLLEAFRPTPLRQVSGPAYPESLHILETGLRGCIETRLSALTPNWWVERVPEELRKQAERRKANRERVWPWLEIGDHPVVEYLGFPDYARIIFEPKNWDQAFSLVFVDADALRVKLRELDPIRTDVAHSRKLTVVNQRRLETYAEDILLAVRSHR